CDAAALRRRHSVRRARTRLGKGDALQPRPYGDDDRDTDRGCGDEGADGGGLQTCSTMAHAFATAKTCCLPRSLLLAASDFPRPHGEDQSDIVEERLPVDAGIEKTYLPA